MATTSDDEQDELDQLMAKIARQTGATVSAYPRPGRAVRGVVLRDIHDDNGSRYEDARLEDDGTLRVTGHDQGPRVTEAFGDDITSYEWVYVIAPGKVATLVHLLDGQDGDDVLALLLVYHQRTDGRIYKLLTGPDVAATFSNWHS
jgi:hypothetical protein